MSRRVSLPARTVARVRDLLVAATPRVFERAQVMDVLAVLDRALAVSPKKVAAKKATASKKRAKRTEHNAETADLWQRAWVRSGGVCECGCGAPLLRGHPALTPELDHFVSRRHGQSIASVWLIARRCHAAKTANEPDWLFWAWKFGEHLRRQLWRDLPDDERRDYVQMQARVESDHRWKEPAPAGKAATP